MVMAGHQCYAVCRVGLASAVCPTAQSVAGALMAPNGRNVSWGRVDYLTSLGLAPWYLPPTAYRRALCRATDSVILICC